MTSHSHAALELPTRVLVTGGAGFVGSAVVRRLLEDSACQVLVLDKLTYAADRRSLETLCREDRCAWVEADIADRPAVSAALEAFQPDAILHTAAETHVDRSIADPAPFVQTNLVGTFALLEAVRTYWSQLSAARRETFRWLQVSTDEVYGSLVGEGDEAAPYRPSNPYSATKAGSDHLVRAWYQTYGLPAIWTHCSNNYGPRQFPEKLIPRMLLSGLAGKRLPLYGSGQQVRDWLYIDDHAAALCCVLQRGQVGQTYHIGASNLRTNRELVETLCQLLDALRPRAAGPYRELITQVADRLGHDARYALDSSKIRRELGWQPKMPLEQGLRTTVQWYCEHESWWGQRD